MNSISKLVGSIAALIVAVSLFWMAINVNRVANKGLRVEMDDLTVTVRQGF